jgi:hypothetical protein
VTISLRELFFPPSLFSTPICDVERAKLLYLSQFSHAGCGGAPVAFCRNGELGCTGCAKTWPVNGNLGHALKAATDFRSLVIA